MPLHNVQISDGSRNTVIEYIRLQKATQPFTVIDVGGGMYSWCYEYVDALVDLVKPENTTKIIFEGDMNEMSTWDKVRNYVAQNGKFDFCICTHALEDIRDPLFVSKQIESIAKAGYIATPSKHRELARFEFGPNHHRGYMHHRWIFDVQNGKFIGFPKLAFIEHIPEFDLLASLDTTQSDLNFYWNNTIDLSLCNGDYMGPTPRAVIQYFERLFQPTHNKHVRFSNENIIHEFIS